MGEREKLWGSGFQVKKVYKEGKVVDNLEQ